MICNIALDNFKVEKMKNLFLSLALSLFGYFFVSAQCQSSAASSTGHQETHSKSACCRKGSTARACCSKGNSSASQKAHCDGHSKATSQNQVPGDRTEKDSDKKENPKKD